MEPSQGMTRYSVRNLLEIIFRRRYWLLIFAIIFAFGTSFIYWYQYYSTYQVSATFIPAVQAAGDGDVSNTDNFSVVVSQSFIKHEEVLDAVMKSVDFDVSLSDLEEAISADVNDAGIAVTVHVVWKDKEQANKILDALKANLSFAITHSAKAGTIKWLDGLSSDSGQPVPGAAQSYLIFIVGAIIGTVVCAVFSVFLGTFDKRVFNLETVRYNGNVHVIGIVGKSKELGAGQYGSTTYQQLTAIALYLKRLTESQDQKLIMCISPTGKCGTSTIVKEIAHILSGMHMKILIVMIKGQGSQRYFQAESVITPVTPGVDRCVFSWDDKEGNPAFTGPISNMLTSAASQYSLILVDCPPLLENIQMSGFASGMDTTLLVCGYGKTKYDDLHAAVALLSREERKPVYCVWNFADKQYNKIYFPIETMLDHRKVADAEPKGFGVDVNL